jgi:hypothetical protein
MAGIEGLKAINTLVGQMITVASGLLAFTVTFVEKFTPKDTSIQAPWTLKTSWVSLVLTIVFGFWTLMAAAGTLNEIDEGKPESNPARWNIRLPALLMIAAFLAALSFLIAAGWAISKQTGAP